MPIVIKILKVKECEAVNSTTEEPAEKTKFCKMCNTTKSISLFRNNTGCKCLACYRVYRNDRVRGTLRQTREYNKNYYETKGRYQSKKTGIKMKL